MTTTLDNFLGRAYAARHGLSGEPLSAVLADCRKAMGKDPDLHTAGATRMLELTDDICVRDHISRVARDFLRDALAPE